MLVIQCAPAVFQCRRAAEHFGQKKIAGRRTARDSCGGGNLNFDASFPFAGSPAPAWHTLPSEVTRVFGVFANFEIRGA